jgi:preprotein translocase subunit SecE
VARDRKRAKQRRQRRGTTVARPKQPGASPEQPGASPEQPGASPEQPGASPEQPIHRADVPGALDHASGEVEEFDAALVRGADGVAATPDAPDDAPAAGAEDELQTPEAASGGGAGGDGSPGALAAGERPSGAPLRGGNRVLGFLRASWAELQRVQWPDRRQVTQATAVVLGFVAIAGLYLGAADFVAKELVELILG